MNRLPKILNFFSIIIFMSVGLLTISFSRDGAKMDQELPEDDKMLYGFINRQGKLLEEKYQMKQSGVGMGGMDKVWLMCLSFHRHGEPLTEKEARKLIINCVDEFLEAVNNDEQIRPFLKEYPFTAKNLDLTILNYGKGQIFHYFPYIAIVADSEGEISFFTKDPSAKFGYHTEKYETYDEAVAILKQESNDLK